jgi:hypothetical protein
MCLVLLFGALCPAFCLQQAGAHACCHTKTAGSHGEPCGHSRVVQAPHLNESPVPPSVIAARADWPERSGSVSFDILNSPASIHQSSPALFRILRI